MPNPSSVPPLAAPAAPSPAEPPAPAAPPSLSPSLSPWAWVAAVVLGQPTAHRVVHAFFFGLAALATVLVGALRGCR